MEGFLEVVDVGSYHSLSSCYDRHCSNCLAGIGEQIKVENAESVYTEAQWWDFQLWNGKGS